MNPLVRKIGPLPAYAWAGIAVALILVAVHIKNGRKPVAVPVDQIPNETAGDHANDTVDIPSSHGAEFPNTGDTGVTFLPVVVDINYPPAPLAPKPPPKKVPPKKAPAKPKPPPKKR